MFGNLDLDGPSAKMDVSLPAVQDAPRTFPRSLGRQSRNLPGLAESQVCEICPIRPLQMEEICQCNAEAPAFFSEASSTVSPAILSGNNAFLRSSLATRQFCNIYFGIRYKGDCNNFVEFDGPLLDLVGADNVVDRCNREFTYIYI